MQPLGRVDATALFRPERDALLELLESLDDNQWHAPTVCEGWTVKDIAAHVIADDLGTISRNVDGYRASFFAGDDWDELLAFINRQNEDWVASMRRLSPGVVVELLRFSGERVIPYFISRDLDAIGDPVDWAGPGPAPVWLDVAREYTERWLHQQQIRDAIDTPGLTDRQMCGPVLDTFVRALPHTYRNIAATDGTHVALRITGEAGGAWSLVMHEGWGLYDDVARAPDATLTLDQNTAWRLFTKGITREAAMSWATWDGPSDLALPALDTVSIIA